VHRVSTMDFWRRPQQVTGNQQPATSNQ